MSKGYDKVITVSELNGAIKAILETTGAFSYLHVKGEVSNFKVASTGMAFFTLSDDESSINCVIFAEYLKRLSFKIENGDCIIANGSIGVFKNRGTYSLRVYQVEKEGQGDALVRLEELKRKLYSEGFFKEENKRPINRYPNKIGVISAPNSAAVKDIVINLKRRYPLCDIYVFPTLVQGSEAPKEIIKAFKKSENYNLDTLIIGRGGGSSEDLSAFNDESLIRELARSSCPIISAVGHEIDTTLIDLLTDKRASTPTGAAELATVDIEDILAKLSDYSLLAQEILVKRINNWKSDLEGLKDGLWNSINNKINSFKEKLSIKKEHLDSLNPLSILSRGYSVTYDNNGNILKNINDIKEGELIQTKLANGSIVSTVKEVSENGK